ncbi:MAG: magnesium/cobalt transporter CorA [Campylobacterales bacterium]|nr:magnesium/cobalt transporter CorA [Campylobacterales bacterium]
MSKSLSNLSHKAGLPPGAIVHVGNVHQEDTKISLVNYNIESIEERNLESLEELLEYRNSNMVTWVRVEGLSDADLIGRIGDLFDIHPLVIEDILTTHQRPKFEEYDHYLYIVLKSLISEDEQFTVKDEQISILVLDHFVFTFKEKSDELFSPVMQRIKTSKGHFRSMGADYLTYAILDVIVDNLFVLIDSLDETTLGLEDSLMADEPTRLTLIMIQKLKRELIQIRKFVSPLRELMAGMLRSDSELIHEKTHIYLRDVSDHAIRIIESIESYQNVLGGLLDIYISSISNKMNEVMKVLTVFASIFIPLTFIAGIYGMNFTDMPELHWKWGYPAIWGVFIMTTVGLLVYFKKKKWL